MASKRQDPHGRGRSGAERPGASPTADAAAEGADDPQREARPGSRPLNILVIDDDPLLHSTLDRALGRHGFHVRGCSSAAEAMRAGTVDAYDVLLLDIGLPDESGIEACKRLREAGYWRGIIMLSGYQSPKVKSEALYAGADDYVTKPFDAGELVARIEALVRRFPRRQGPLLQIEGRTIRVGGVAVKLSSTEREILLRIHGAGAAGIEKTALLDLVAAADPEHAIHVHVSRIRKKLGRAGWHLRLDDGRFRIQLPSG